MTPYQCYLEAARICFRQQNKPSCWAVTAASGYNMELKRNYADLMLNGENDVTLLWGDGNEYSAETQQVRVLLLCMMAEISRDKS